MRIWHYKLIEYLPKKQLMAMRYELGDMIKQYPNIKNGLTKYANNYAISFLGMYFGRVCVECDKRGIKCSKDYNSSIYNIVYSKSERLVENYTFNEHNDRYLVQCLYNLQEKADREIISKKEWKLIEDKFGEYLT